MQFTSAAAEVDPLELYYTHSKIRSHFSKGGRRIVDTISAIEQGELSADDLPPMTVVIGASGHLFCLDNRRLFVFKYLRRKGLLSKNKVTVLMKKAPPKDLIKYTIEKCSLNCTIMKEKDIEEGEAEKESDSNKSNFPGTSTTVTEKMNMNSPLANTNNNIGIDLDNVSVSTTTTTGDKSVREKNDKKKYKPTGEVESDQERYQRQKRIIAEKQEEFRRQALERQQQKQLETAAQQLKAVHREGDDDSDSDSGDSDGDESENESDEEVFVCDICRKEFKSEQQIEQHLITKAHKKKLKESKKKGGGGGEARADIRLVTRAKKKHVKTNQVSPIQQVEEEEEVEEEENSGATVSSQPTTDLPAPLGEHTGGSADAISGHDEGKEEEEVEEKMKKEVEGGTGVGTSSEEASGIVDGSAENDTLPSQVIVRKSDPVNDALMLQLIQRRIAQLEIEIDSRDESALEGQHHEEGEDEHEWEGRGQTRVTAGSLESRALIAQMEARGREGRQSQELARSFQLEGAVASKALPAQYVHKQGAAHDARMAENRHHTGSHYVMAGGVQFQRGVRVKGVVSRHSKQAAVRNGPVGGGAQNMKRMGLLNEQRETGKKGSSSGGGKKGKKKSRKNPSD